MLNGDATLGFEAFGNGREPVIALHDWMSTASTFDDVRPYLDTETFTYFFVDHRGYGRSREMDVGPTVAAVADDVVALADSLDLDAFHLVGHSMSGMIAQRVSLDAPQRLKSLLLVTPVLASGMPLDEDGQALFTGAIEDDAAWTAVAHAVTSGRLPDRFYARKLEQHRANVEPAAFGDFLRLWSTSDFSAEMEGLTTPVLVLAGEHDFPAFTAETYRAAIGSWYADSRVETFANAGHYPMTEMPPRFARVVEDFLRRHI